MSPDLFSGDAPIHSLVLYSTEACHLCHEAETLLRSLAHEGAALEWQVVDIALNDALFERYGLRIPVLRRADGQELGWPFDRDALSGFLADSR